MASKIETQVIIESPLEEVWATLSSLEIFEVWNSRTHFSLPPVIGETQSMRVKLFGVWLSVPVKIQIFSNMDEIRWVGGISGIFTGSHYFKLVRNNDERTTLIQGEEFDGMLVPLLLPLLKNELQSLYDAMSSDIKKYSEKKN